MSTPTIPVAYIDANIFKFAATVLLRLFPRTQVIQYNGQTTEHRYFEPRYVNPNDGITNPRLKREVQLIRAVTEHVKTQRLKAVADIETLFETWRLPKMDSFERRLYGAPVGTAPPPIHTDRLLFCARHDPIELQRNFLQEIRHARFLELQQITGAYHGNGRYNWNQLLDAYALWCAEHNQCDYFLTLDFKLIRVVNRAGVLAPETKLVTPSQLLAAFES